MFGAAIVGLTASDVWAQASASPTAADAQLPEVVVTAQKRSESVQHVPIAVDAYTRDDLERRGATSIEDVARFTPNVQISDSYAGAAPTWVIRGVGLQDFNPNNTPAASIFVDDIYQTSNVMGGASLFDVDRVEVLKGPQGGL
jgi:iron complex outermembrane receptor protein